MALILIIFFATTTPEQRAQIRAEGEARRQAEMRERDEQQFARNRERAAKVAAADKTVDDRAKIERAIALKVTAEQIF